MRGEGRRFATTVLAVTLAQVASGGIADARCTCRAAYAVPADAGDVTITKVRVSSVKEVFGNEIILVAPYATKWKGNAKIKAGHTTTFIFKVSSNCTGGTRRFAFKRSDKKTCYGHYPSGSHDYDLCGLDDASHHRAAPVISCEPNEWTQGGPPQ